MIDLGVQKNPKWKLVLTGSDRLYSASKEFLQRASIRLPSYMIGRSINVAKSQSKDLSSPGDQSHPCSPQLAIVFTKRPRYWWLWIESDILYLIPKWTTLNIVPLILYDWWVDQCNQEPRQRPWALLEIGLSPVSHSSQSFSLRGHATDGGGQKATLYIQLLDEETSTIG